MRLFITIVALFLLSATAQAQCGAKVNVQAPGVSVNVEGGPVERLRVRIGQRERRIHFPHILRPFCKRRGTC